MGGTGCRLAEVSRRFDVGLHVVARNLDRHGVPATVHPLERAVLEELYVKQGWGIRAVAARLGVSGARVRAGLPDHAAPIRPPGRPPGSGAVSVDPAVDRSPVRTGHVTIERVGVDLTVRTAEAGDRDAIVALVREAFAAGGHDPQEEVEIVESTWSRQAGPAELELVAVDGGQVVGHVLAAYGELGGRPAVGVAPLCVRPARQGEGVGTALMAELLRRAEQAGLPLLVVLGDPTYYSRFGFEPAGPLGIRYPPVGENSPYFQVRRLTTYQPGSGGAFTYCWEL